MGLAARDEYLAALVALLPPGRAIPQDPDSDWHRFLAGLAPELQRLDAFLELVIAELDPQTTSALLARWEAITGLPEPCADPAAIPTDVPSRRKTLVAKLATEGNLTAAFIERAAADLGWTISLDDSDFPYLDVTTTGLTDEPFILDASPLGSSLDGIGGQERLECFLERIKPAHLSLRFIPA